MIERPILFSGPMVRAILDGTKTQTRRVVKDRVKNGGQWFTRTPTDFATPEMLATYTCPFGQPGDRLWVREAFALQHRSGRFDLPAFESESWSEETCLPSLGYGCHLYHRASDEALVRGKFKPEAIRWRPSIHMPRWASRITLVVTDVRVERLQEITEEDAVAEGFPLPSQRDGMHPAPVTSLREMWNARGYGWDANPWVWVVEFKRVGGAK